MSDLHAEARRRAGYHGGDASTRQFHPAYEVIGLIAEIEWARETGAPRPDTDAIGSGGDGGHDFVHEMWTPSWDVATIHVDVKGATNPRAGLLVEPSRVRCEVAYVLGLVDLVEQNVPVWLGWAWGWEVRQRPARMWPRYLLNHYLPAVELRSVSELLGRLL